MPTPASKYTDTPGSICKVAAAGTVRLAVTRYGPPAAVQCVVPVGNVPETFVVAPVSRQISM